MATSVKFLNYNIASDPTSIEKRKTDGFLSTEIDLLRDLGLLDLSSGVTKPVGGILPSEIGAFLNWIAQGQKGEMPPSAKRILCSRLQTLKNEKSLPSATKQFAQGLVTQLELLVGDCTGVETISKAAAVNTKPSEPIPPMPPAGAPMPPVNLQKALLPLQTKLMSHIDEKFAASKSDTAALREFLKAEIRAQLQSENRLPKIESALDAIGKQISKMEPKAESRPRLDSEILAQSVQSAKPTPPQNTTYTKVSKRLGNETRRFGSNLSNFGSGALKGISSLMTRKSQPAKQTSPPPAVSVTKKRFPAASTSTQPSPASSTSTQPSPASTASPQPSPASTASSTTTKQPAKKSMLSSLPSLPFSSTKKKPFSTAQPPTSIPTSTSTSSSQRQMYVNPLAVPRTGKKSPRKTRKHRTRK